MKTGSVDAQVVAILLEHIRSRHDVDQTAVQETRHRQGGLLPPATTTSAEGRTRCVADVRTRNRSLMPRSRRFLHASERTPWAGIINGPETAPTAPDRASRSVMAVDDGHAQSDVSAGTECGRAASRKPQAPQSTTGTAEPNAGSNPRSGFPIGKHRESRYRPRPAAHASLAKRSTARAWPSSPITSSCILRWPRRWPTLPRIRPSGDHHAAPDISSCVSKHEADTTPMAELHAISRGVISRRQSITEMRLPETGQLAMAFTVEFAGASKTLRTRIPEASFQLAYRSWNANRFSFRTRMRMSIACAGIAFSVVPEMQAPGHDDLSATWLTCGEYTICSC